MKNAAHSFKQMWRALKLLRHQTTVDGLQDLSRRYSQHLELQLRFPSCMLDPSLLILGDLTGLHLGARVRISHGTVVGLDPGALVPALTIGDDTYVGEYGNIRVAASTSIEIGARCLIAQFVSLIAANHVIRVETCVAESGVDLTKSGVLIGNDVWVGAGATILPGVRVGNRAVIGANSVVTRSVPADEIWAGNPAKRIGCRGPMHVSTTV